jgi:hypothetical protein
LTPRPRRICTSSWSRSRCRFYKSSLWSKNFVQIWKNLDFDLIFSQNYVFTLGRTLNNIWPKLNNKSYLNTYICLEANPTIASYNTTSSMLRFENKNILLCLEKRSS